ncbi:MAG: DedA family protein [Bacteroidales bacterium]|nr:DedA family protein [Bacteroidales bacterium]
MSSVVDWYMNNLNYYTVTLLMAVESSFIPFPSEVVVPPAAYAACNPESNMYVTNSNFINILLVILFATIGALLGGFVNYYLAYFLGRPIIYKFADSKLGHLCMINSEKVQKAEAYFVKHGNVSTFIGRLVPGIRQLISIPAGLAKMKLAPFILYTCLGSGLWNVVLAVLGYVAHGQQDIINKYNTEFSYGLLILGALFIAYLIWKGIQSKKKNNRD